MTYGIASFLEALPTTPELLAVGEPTHGEPAFPQLRNDLVPALVERGFRSVVLEIDRVAALTADAYVAGGDISLDQALGEGFSHGWGEDPASRDLLVLLREINQSRAINEGRATNLSRANDESRDSRGDNSQERITLYGFDAPLEIASAPSPRRYLRHVHDYLGGDDWHEIDRLLGDDERWSATEAVRDASRSIGRGPDAVALRAIADDLLTRLWCRPETATAAWRVAEAHATAALGLLRYHAVAATPGPDGERFARLGGVRDALMAHNLLTIRTYEADRGPTLVFAHNSHLQRHAIAMRLGGTEAAWAGAGALVAPLLGNRYVFLAGSLGASPAKELPAPQAGSYEAELGDRLTIVAAADLPKAAERPGTWFYFPLDDATVAQADGVLHVPTGISMDVLADRILALPGVDQQIADGNSRFFFVGPDRRQPFATMVDKDVPGFDEESQLGREGVFRLNMELGRGEFERRFGYPPKDFEEHRGEYDFARHDTLFPHPGYALYGWGSVVRPGPHLLPLIDELIAHAHARAVDRHERAERRNSAGQ